MAKVRGAIDPDAGATSMGKMITPEQLAKSGTEHGHQCAIIQWTVIKGLASDGRPIEDLDLLFAIPNGGDRNVSVAASLKAEGVRSGVPDLCWPVPRGQFAGLYLELKVPKHYGTKSGGRSDNQIKWQKRLLAQRYAVVTAYGWQAGVTALVQYWMGSLTMPEGEDCAMFEPRELP